MNGDAHGTHFYARRTTVLLCLVGILDLVAPICATSSPASGSPCRFDELANGELSLPHAVDLALCSNAELQSAAATVRIRAAQLGEARAEYWPSLTANATELRESTRYLGAAPPAATADTAVTLYGALNWRLFDFGGRGADSEAASKLLEAALSTQDATVQKVLGGVVEGYFDAVTANALLKAKSEGEALATETLASADRRLRQGDGAQSDVLQAKTALARAALDSNRARGNYENSLAVLAYSIGLAPGVHLEVPPEVEALTAADDENLAAWLDDARRRHPAIAAAQADVEAAKAQVRSVRSSGSPTVDFQVDYYANGFPQEGLAATRQRSTTVGIAVTIPVFDGFLNRYKVHEAQANVNLKQAILIDTERLTLTEIVKAYSDASTSVANLRASQALLEAALASQASSNRRYGAGATDILEVLATQGSLADARQERVRSLADWRSARLRLLAASGILSAQAIDTP